MFAAHRHLIAVVAVLGAGATPPVRAQLGPADTAPRQQRDPWPIALGKRVEQVRRACAMVDRVVLVPDGATYIDELSRWSPAGRWPVLIEDDQYAAMFIRRFQPSQIVRRHSVERSPANAARVSRRELEAVVKTAWGGDPLRDSIPDVFRRVGHTPPGVVITSTNDPAWTAAVALAAGRGQPLAWLDTPFGRPNQVLDADRYARLREAVDGLVRETGYPYANLGDAIDTITLCRDVGGRVNMAANPGTVDIRAVTDLLGRVAGGRRYAFTGWIFGDEVRCAYTAMCSLFLQRSAFELYNTYSDEAVRRAYGLREAAAMLPARGFEVTTHDIPDTTRQAWLNLLPRGFTTDVLVMNSGGNADHFVLSDEHAYCGDVPILNVPMALHFIHSFSLKAPANLNTIGGQWLAHGVYAYIGSVDEPLLSAFIPPKFFVDRCVNLVPFLIAGRKWDAAPAWKINTLGDPLMICRPPVLGEVARATAPTEFDGLDLNEHVKVLMRRAVEDRTGEAIAEAMATLDLLGRDAIAIRLWQLADQLGLADAAAPGAIGPLFRMGLATATIRAAEAIPDPDDFAVDMLWHMLTPRLRSVDEQTLLLLEHNIRSCQGHADLERLAPYLTAQFGAAHTRAAIEREIDRTRNPRYRKFLRKLLPG